MDVGRGPGEGEGEEGKLWHPEKAAELSASRVRPSVAAGAGAWLACHCTAQHRAHFLGPTRPPRSPWGWQEAVLSPTCVLGMLLAGVGKLPVLMMLILQSGSPINLVLTSLTSL